MNLNLEHNIASVGDSQMIPLINVVFLMLAFILITGNIEKSNERHADLQELNIPYSTSKLDQEQHDVVVTLVEPNFALVDNTRTTIERIVEVFPLSASEIADAKVLIRADATLSAQSTKEVLKRLRDLGLKRISLATSQVVSGSS